MSQACRKVPYPSQAAAMVAARALAEMNRPLRAYHCTVAGCRAWHLTSQPWLSRRDRRGQRAAQRP